MSDHTETLVNLFIEEGSFYFSSSSSVLKILEGSLHLLFDNDYELVILLPKPDKYEMEEMSLSVGKSNCRGLTISEEGDTSYLVLLTGKPEGKFREIKIDTADIYKILVRVSKDKTLDFLNLPGEFAKTLIEDRFKPAGARFFKPKKPTKGKPKLTLVK